MNAIQRDRAYGRRLQRMKPDAIVHRGDRQPSPAERMQRYVSLRAKLISPPRVQREAVRSPTHAPLLAPSLPASEQQATIPTTSASTAPTPTEITP